MRDPAKLEATVLGAHQYIAVEKTALQSSARTNQQGVGALRRKSREARQLGAYSGLKLAAAVEVRFLHDRCRYLRVREVVMTNRKLFAAVASMALPFLLTASVTVDANVVRSNSTPMSAVADSAPLAPARDPVSPAMLLATLCLGGIVVGRR